MPQLIAIGLVGGLIWYGYRAFKKQMAKVNEELKNNQETDKKPGYNPKVIDELEIGEDGVYRPKQNKDKS